MRHSGQPACFGDRYAAIVGLALEHLVDLHVAFGGRQVVFGGFAGHGLFRVVVEQALEHVAGPPGEIPMGRERADTRDQLAVAVHQGQRQIGFFGARHESVPVPLQLLVRNPPIGRGVPLPIGRDRFDGRFGGRGGGPGGDGFDKTRFFARRVPSCPMRRLAGDRAPVLAGAGMHLP